MNRCRTTLAPTRAVSDWTCADIPVFPSGEWFKTCLHTFMLTLVPELWLCLENNIQNMFFPF